MPRLSIIIAHQGNDSALEGTILSVLENQPSHSEVIVVHDGSYSDPYALGDELLLMHEPTSNPTTLLNCGLRAACSPTVCVLSAGSQVQFAGWADAACETLESDSSIGAVAVEVVGLTNSTYGISSKAVDDSSKLQRGLIDQSRPGDVAGPSISGGFYNRRTLLALDGWNESLRWENIDLELALLMNELDITCESVESAVVQSLASVRMQQNESVKEVAELSIAYGISHSGTSAAMSDLLRGCLSGNISGSVAWATGIMSGRRSSSLRSRIQVAQERLAVLQEDRATERHSQSYRRAA